MSGLAATPALALDPVDTGFNGSNTLPTDWSSTGELRGPNADRYVELTGDEYLQYTFSFAEESNLEFSFWYGAFSLGPRNQALGDAFSISLAPASFTDGVARTNAGGNINALIRQLDRFRDNNPGPGGPAGLDAQYLTFAPIRLEADTTYTLGFTNLNNSITRLDDMQFSVTSVPEPETWAMLFAGLGVVGFLGQRRRRQDGLR
ncbi:MAG: PEP-CTERM sorting domain-containing protein [Burkholderiales bacterium]|nr:PEP-CTERM sorting domain-containing protein [Burkholderiales bacterium]